MSKKKAWWKKISIRSVGTALGTVAAFIGGGTAATDAAAQPAPAPAGIDKNTLLLIGGGVLLLVLIFAFATRKS